MKSSGIANGAQNINGKLADVVVRVVSGVAKCVNGECPEFRQDFGG